MACWAVAMPMLVKLPPVALLCDVTMPLPSHSGRALPFRPDWIRPEMPS